MTLAAIPTIIQEIFTAPTQDSKIIVKGKEIEVKRREKNSNKYHTVKR